MEFLNKIANAVVSNPLIKEFEMQDTLGQCGPWTIQNAVKRSTKEKVSAFILSKKTFEKLSRSNKESTLELYRNGVRLLTKLHHPKILTVQHPLEETRDCLAFATEPIVNTLSSSVKANKFTDVEIRYGILQILDGLSFLHNDIKRCHNNFNLDSIVINNQGLWKIFGFEFSLLEDDLSNIAYNENGVAYCQPDLNFISPEILSMSGRGTAADMYSLGCFIYALFNRGSPLRNAISSRDAIRKSEDIVSMSSLGNIPQDAQNDVKQLLSLHQDARQSVSAFQQCGFLSHIGAISLQFLDHIMLKNRTQKITFFKELPSILPKIPMIVRKQRILTQLFECCKEVDLIPFVLPSVFHIGADLEKNDFIEYISPSLRNFLSLTEPPAIPLVILQNFTLIIGKSNTEEIKNYILPVMLRCLERGPMELHENALKLIPEIVGLLDYQALRHQLIPKIRICCLETTSLKIRVSSLLCIAKITESPLVEKGLVSDLILPLLEQVPSREPAVLMSIVGIYQKLMKNKTCLIDTYTLATRCIPILFPMAICPTLNLQQFNTCMSVIKDMVARVERDQSSKLKQIAQTKEEEQQSISFSKNVAENKQVNDLVSNMDQMFSSEKKPAPTLATSELLKPTPVATQQKSEPRNNYNILYESREATKTQTFDSGMFDLVSKPSIGNTSATGHKLGFSSNVPTNYSMNNSSNMVGGMSMPGNYLLGSFPNNTASNLMSGSMNNSFSSMNAAAGTVPRMSMPINNNISWSMNSSYGNFNSYANQPMNAGVVNSTLYPQSSGSIISQSNVVSKKASDMSGLDNLFGANKPAPSLKQLQQKPCVPSVGMNTSANVDINDIFG